MNKNHEHAQNRDTFPLNVIWDAFHLLRNSENSSWDVNGTHLFRNFTKVVLFSRWKIPGEKAGSIYEFSQGITGSSRLLTHGDISATILNFGGERINEWKLCQMEHILHSMDLSREVSESFW